MPCTDKGKLAAEDVADGAADGVRPRRREAGLRLVRREDRESEEERACCNIDADGEGEDEATREAREEAAWP